MVPFLLERHAAVAQRHMQGAGKELAGWLPSGPWLLPTPTVGLLQTVVGSARLEENDLNFFLFLVLFCWFTLCFLLLGGVFRVGRAPGRDTATSVGIFLIPGTQRLQPLSS